MPAAASRQPPVRRRRVPPAAELRAPDAAAPARDLGAAGLPAPDAVVPARGLADAGLRAPDTAAPARGLGAAGFFCHAERGLGFAENDFGVVFGVSVRGREGKHGGAWRKRQAQVLLSCRQVEK